LSCPQDALDQIGALDEGVGQSDVARELALPLQELHTLVFGLVLTPVEGGGGSEPTEKPDLRLVN
jgi:hypothetical protein